MSSNKKEEIRINKKQEKKIPEVKERKSITDQSSTRSIGSLRETKLKPILISTIPGVCCLSLFLIDFRMPSWDMLKMSLYQKSFLL